MGWDRRFYEHQPEGRARASGSVIPDRRLGCDPVRGGILTGGGDASVKVRDSFKRRRDSAGVAEFYNGWKM